MERIIVRRGRYLTFELLKRQFGADPNVDIVWDRRREERRSDLIGSPVERRQAERRGAPPVEWERLDYLFTARLSGAKRPTPQLTPEQEQDALRS